MKVFTVIWLGQVVSALGSGLTGFALSVWVYQETGSTTLFALNLIFYTLPNLLISPIAGALVDRWDRRVMMILSDIGAGVSSLAVALLLFAGHLEIWHVYLAAAVNSAFGALQWPAYTASTTLLVPKKHLARAGGMVQIGEGFSTLLAPAIAGILLVSIGLPGIVLVDFVTFLFAMGTLFFVRIPKPPRTEDGRAGQGPLWQEALYGWKYLVARSGLMWLMIFYAANNFLNGLTNPLLAPLILNLTSADVLGYVASLVGIGALAGTLLITTWGGPKKRVQAILVFVMLKALCIVLMGLRPSVALIAVGGFGVMFLNPMINAISQAVWQTKVAPDVQGRVFSVRRMVSLSTLPLAYLIAGPLNDQVFGPLLMPEGALADTVGRLVGVGPGRGAGFFFILIGFAVLLDVIFLGFFNPRIRRLEDEVPDAIGEAMEAATGLATD